MEDTLRVVSAMVFAATDSLNPVLMEDTLRVMRINSSS